MTWASASVNSQVPAQPPVQVPQKSKGSGMKENGLWPSLASWHCLERAIHVPYPSLIKQWLLQAAKWRLNGHVWIIIRAGGHHVPMRRELTRREERTPEDIPNVQWPPNIATKERSPKEDGIRKHQSRFPCHTEKPKIQIVNLYVVVNTVGLCLLSPILCENMFRPTDCGVHFIKKTEKMFEK